jgi:YVTN family beta-propeller protein
VSLIQAGTIYTTRLAVDPVTDTVYLGDLAGNLSVINGATSSVTTTLSVGTYIVGVAVDSATNTVYVALSTGSIAVINGATNKVTTTIAEPPGSSPAGIAVDSATDTVYVANYGAANVTVIDGAKNAITTAITTGTGNYPEGVAVDESSNVVWVTEVSGAVIAVSGATNSITNTVGLGGRSPSSIAVNPTTDTVYATDVRNDEVVVIDGATGKVTTTIDTSAGLASVAVDSVTDTAYATSFIAPLGTTWVIDGSSNAVTDTLTRGGLNVAVDQSTGIAYEASYAPLTRPLGAWVITPSAANATSPVISSAIATSFLVGQAGSFTAVAHALPAATFAETGTLPAGITFSADGTLAGTPAAGTTGAYPITITASNGVAPAYSQSFVLTVDQAPAITSGSSATFRVGTASSFALQASGYPAPSFYYLGQLAAGISLAGSTTAGWQLAGTPAAGSGGVYPVTLNAYNGVGSTAMQNFTLTVDEAPGFTGSPQATFLAGSPGNFIVPARGYPAPTFTETGPLPSGVQLTPQGSLTGTPGQHAGGTYDFTVTASNGIGPAASEAFTLTVNQAPAITSAGHVTFRAGRQHTFTFHVTGFPAPRLTESGGLPRGVHFRVRSNGTAVLTGRPGDADRTYVITIIAANGVGRAARQTFRLTIT